jgi:hypothetical protein
MEKIKCSKGSKKSSKNKGREGEGRELSFQCLRPSTLPPISRLVANWVLWFDFIFRVKVTFLNEPGEGSGVARGFYTALAEALLVNQRLPNLEMSQATSGSSASLAAAASKSMQFSLIQRLRGTREARMGRSLGSGGPKTSSTRGGRDASRNLSYEARPFTMNGEFYFVLLYKF